MNPPHRNLMLRQFDPDLPEEDVSFKLDVHLAKKENDVLWGWFYHNREQSVWSDIHDPKHEWRCISIPTMPRKVLLGMLWEDADGFYVTTPADCRHHNDRAHADGEGMRVRHIDTFVVSKDNKAQLIQSERSLRVQRKGSVYYVKRIRTIENLTQLSTPPPHAWRYFVYLTTFLTIARFVENLLTKELRLAWRCPKCNAPDNSLSIEGMGRQTERIVGTSLATRKIVPLITTKTHCGFIGPDNRRPCSPGYVRVACQGMIQMLSDDDLSRMATNVNSYVLYGHWVDG
jgi:hypothetical protein